MLSPAAICRGVPDGLDDTAAAMAQPLAVALHAVRRGARGRGPRLRGDRRWRDRRVAVVGAAARGAGPLIAIDLDDERLATAATLGATLTVNAGRADATAAVLDATGGQGAHVVIEATGAPASPAAAAGHGPPGRRHRDRRPAARPAQVDLFAVSTREVDLHGTLAHICGEDLGEALGLLAAGRLAPAVLGGVIALDDLVEKGLRPLAERTARGKIVVDVGGCVTAAA